MSHPGGVVTPEAVRLEFEAAGVGSRSVAFVLDLACQLAVLLAVGFGGQLVLAGAGVLPEWLAVVATLLLAFAVFWGYPVAFETLWRGRTPGKAAMGLRVVTVEGAPVRFRHAAIRAALALVDFYLLAGLPGVASALVTREHQRLGDLVAGTLVLRERTGVPAPTSVTFQTPPGLEGYAATIDPAGLTTDDYAALRGFLLRAPGFAEAVREELAGRLAAQVAARLRHDRPDDVAPEHFLTAVAARYQQRGDQAASLAPAASVAPRPPASDTPTGPPATSGGFAPPG